MQKLPLIAVMAMFLAAGCVGQTTVPPTGTGNGLEITSLTSDASEQFSGRTVRIFADFQNSGESTVFTADSLVWLSGPIGSGILQWPLTGNQSYAFKRDLSPRDPQRDIPPGTDTTRWTLTAPTLDKGQRKTDTFTARAYYDYTTKAIGEVISYTEAESTAAKDRGEQLEKSSFSTTVGPVGMAVSVVPDPVTVLDNNEIATVEIVISNNGAGTVYRAGTVKSTNTAPSLTFDQLNQVQLMVTTDLTESGTTCKTGSEQELIGGKPTTITCDFKVSNTQPLQRFPVKVTLNYGYYVEKSIELTAMGR